MINQDLVKNESEKLYLFGYGSLLWKVEFNYTRKLVGFANGYVRQFWLLSDDHRGTPEKPGRVVTLVKSDDKNAKVFGVAYEIDSREKTAIFEYLDYREKCGYSLNEIDFHSSEDGSRIQAYCYYASPDNAYYSPEENVSKIALHIFNSEGPSGKNRDYLFNLCEAIRKITKTNNNQDSNQKALDFKDDVFENDKHLFELEILVKNLESLNSNQTN